VYYKQTKKYKPFTSKDFTNMIPQNQSKIDENR